MNGLLLVFPLLVTRKNPSHVFRFFLAKNGSWGKLQVASCWKFSCVGFSVKILLDFRGFIGNLLYGKRDSRENRLCLLDIFISMLLFLQRVKLAAFEEHFAEKVCVHCCVVRVLMLLILNAMLEPFPVQSWKRNLLICLCEIYDLKLFHFILFIAINNNFTLLP